MGFQLTRDQESSWPAEADCPGFRADAMRFMGEVRDLSVKVMQLFAEGVGLVRPPLSLSFLVLLLLLLERALTSPAHSPRTRSPRAPSRPTTTAATRTTR